MKSAPDQASPAVREIVETYLDDVAASLKGLPAADVDDVVAELRADLYGRLDASASPQDAENLVRAMGLPDSDIVDLVDSAFPVRPNAGRGYGTLLGIPYDIRVPSPERVASRWWNPLDRTILVPRVFGLGWGLNFGAVAVRLHLIDPDSEDQPFALVSRSAFLIALSIPIAITLALGVSYLTTPLPIELPAHWNLAGMPDDYWPRQVAFGMLFGIALATTLWAVGLVRSRRSQLAQGVAVAGAAFAAALAGAVWILTLTTALTPFRAWWFPPTLIFSSLIVPFVIPLWMSRVGRAEEIARDSALKT